MSEMAEGNSESSHLVGSNSSHKPSYINLTSNICAALFVGIIIYCCFKDGATLFSFHPTLMALGWVIVMTSAINAITPGDLATEWMPVRLRSVRHWVLQLFGGALLTIGFIVILVNKFIHDKEHFVTLHAKFGLSSLIFMIITMLGGVGALYSLQLKHILAPIYTKLTHATVGLTTFSLGIITIILALFSSWWSFGEILRYTNLILVLIVMTLTILRPGLKIYFRIRERVENIN